MKRPIFKATIVGYKNVAKTGVIRMPESMRVRFYAGGEVIITTRGRIEPHAMGERSYSSVVAKLSQLEAESRANERPRRLRKSKASG